MVKIGVNNYFFGSGPLQHMGRLFEHYFVETPSGFGYVRELVTRSDGTGDSIKKMGLDYYNCLYRLLVE